MSRIDELEEDKTLLTARLEVSTRCIETLLSVRHGISADEIREIIADLCKNGQDTTERATDEKTHS